VGVASKKKEDGMDIFPWGLVGGAIALVVFAFLASQMVFTTHTKQAAVIEKLVKFDRIAGPGRPSRSRSSRKWCTWKT
jgi:hypothetical protein